MSKYYKAEDVLAIFSEEERPLNWTDSESEIQAQNDFDCYKGMIESLPTIEVSEDCISREWVLEEYQKGKEKIGSSEFFAELMWLVKNAPSVVPCRAEGEWGHLTGSAYRCSNCDEYTKSSKPFEKPKCNYCPNCGAKMKGAEE